MIVYDVRRAGGLQLREDLEEECAELRAAGRRRPNGAPLPGGAAPERANRLARAREAVAAERRRRAELTRRAEGLRAAVLQRATAAGWMQVRRPAGEPGAVRAKGVSTLSAGAGLAVAALEKAAGPGRLVLGARKSVAIPLCYPSPLFPLWPRFARGEGWRGSATEAQGRARLCPLSLSRLRQIYEIPKELWKCLQKRQILIEYTVHPSLAAPAPDRRRCVCHL